MTLPTHTELIITFKTDDEPDVASRPEVECPICYELATIPFTTTCNHSFCHECIATWLERSNTCPNCRQVLFSRPSHGTAVLDMEGSDDEEYPDSIPVDVDDAWMDLPQRISRFRNSQAGVKENRAGAGRSVFERSFVTHGQSMTRTKAYWKDSHGCSVIARPDSKS